MKAHNKLAASLSQSHLTASLTRAPNRTALKMVASTFQPPQQTQASSYPLTQKKSQPSLNPNMPYPNPKQSHKQFQSEFQSQHSYSSNFNPSIEFISSLVSIRDMMNFDEGDCIPIDTDDRWVVISGEVRVVGVNGGGFVAKDGFVFFASPETKRKVAQVIVVSPTTACKIPQQVFKQSIRNYLYIKNSQKIKFLQYCPFLTWNQSLSQDLAIVMDSFEPADKDVMIYKDGDEAQYLYFVKEGIVLLERLGKSCNQIILDFQRHYQSSYLNQDQGLIIVRKGMIFGVDGILIKEINKQINLLQSDNPEQPHIEDNQTYTQNQFRLKTTRIYTAKSIGKCQLYRIHKNVLETYLKSHNGIISKHQSHISNKELDRICIEYTNLLMGSNRVSKEVKKKNFQFDISKDEAEMESKRKKVEEIKLQQRKMKKVHNLAQARKHEPIQEMQQFPILVRSPRRNKLSQPKAKDISLPSLNKKYVQNLIFKKLQSKQGQKYMAYKKKIDATLLGKQLQIPNVKKQNKKMDDLQFIKVKSYRSLLSSLG